MSRPQVSASYGPRTTRPRRTISSPLSDAWGYRPNRHPRVGGSVPGYDENLLAQARSYDHVPLAGALWSLDRSARDWRDALTLGLARSVVLEHAGRGKQRAADVARNNA